MTLFFTSCKTSWKYEWCLRKCINLYKTSCL